MSTNIRSAIPAEARQLSDLAMRSKAYWGYTREFMEACREELTVTSARILDRGFDYRVVVIGDDIAGYYALEELSEAEFELEALFIEPAYIGRGLGRLLVEHAISNVADKGGDTLIIQGDPNATEFYAAVGAQHIGDRESGSVPGRLLPLFQIRVVDDSPS